MITWIEDPLKYVYLRKTRYLSTSRRFPVKTIGVRTHRFARLIGYELISHPVTYQYTFEFYWLKTHDRDLSPDDVYAGPKRFGGKMPVEAVNPIELVKEHPFTPNDRSAAGGVV
jgi:hypothetical protein